METNGSLLTCVGEVALLNVVGQKVVNFWQHVCKARGKNHATAETRQGCEEDLTSRVLRSWPIIAQVAIPS